MCPPSFSCSKKRFLTPESVSLENQHLHPHSQPKWVPTGLTQSSPPKSGHGDWFNKSHKLSLDPQIQDFCHFNS